MDKSFSSPKVSGPPPTSKLLTDKATTSAVHPEEAEFSISILQICILGTDDLRSQTTCDTLHILYAAPHHALQCSYIEDDCYEQGAKESDES
jgi:hypothetical protein